MERQILYSKLMKLVEAGDAEIEAWSDDFGVTVAKVRRFGRNGSERVEVVRVIGIPAEVSA